MKRSREERRQQALQMQEERNKRTPQQQIERLDAKLGKGLGAVKERARLAKMMEAK